MDNLVVDSFETWALEQPNAIITEDHLKTEVNLICNAYAKYHTPADKIENLRKKLTNEFRGKTYQYVNTAVDIELNSLCENEKCQNKIDASNKINKQKLISVFTPVVNRTRYPKIESSSPYCSLRLKEEGFIVNPTNSEENPNPMYNSLKESNINDGYSSIYEKILKNQEDGINLPVIDSSKIYQFQK